ncbi:hypothetical protein BLOT_000134 [Blomia tropicalis]|nr:hypothetical protein BLOT_000134 [Blomia tropicalis]
MVVVVVWRLVQTSRHNRVHPHHTLAALFNVNAFHHRFNSTVRIRKESPSREHSRTKGTMAPDDTRFNPILNATNQAQACGHQAKQANTA